MKPRKRCKSRAFCTAGSITLILFLRRLSGSLRLKPVIPAYNNSIKTPAPLYSSVLTVHAIEPATPKSRTFSHSRNDSGVTMSKPLGTSSCKSFSPNDSSELHGHISWSSTDVDEETPETPDTPRTGIRVMEVKMHVSRRLEFGAQGYILEFVPIPGLHGLPGES
ncbi:hypothetical protein K435DRAFT_22821 [Dendrothele bispora CBS 962.96]|uniref:Uncharacterized protein n=1 Tax=Dendrothele bispora (strain CBS 962.96) TaxID=1314807 RepID=A0A4S8MSM0_DENBC|nr:hypothetical protein K435DRAFT_22821 [Dendrothele bispora CBS 962.96]